MFYHEGMSLPAWLPICISAAGVIISVSAFAYQVHRARFNQSVDLLFRLENDFFGPAKKIPRVKACRDLTHGSPFEAEPILDFFETMALLLRRGALDEEMVAHTFFYWIDNYYAALNVAIQQRQSADPHVWKDFTEMVASLRKTQSKRIGRAVPARTPEQTAAFLAEEQMEAVV